MGKVTHFYWFIVGRWYWLRLQERLELISKEVIDELF